MRSTLLGLSCILLLWGSAEIARAESAAQPIDPASEAYYLAEIKPLLQAKCVACHGVLKQEAALRLDTRRFMQQGGDSGSILEDGETSLLLERVTADEDHRMPPPHEGAALRPDEIAKLRGWLLAGAAAPEEMPATAPDEHWAFQPIDIDRVLAQVEPLIRIANGQPGGYAHPVDALVQRLRTARGLQPTRPVQRSLLIRRLYLDLIGLPPTVEQLEDSRDLAAIADELLERPEYGQRWGRHWMDIWRYSDWYGLGEQLRNSQKHLWHWRDWIIDSLNDDKGYDRMILEMLAGDELEPANMQVVAGTGFLARNYYLFNRTTWLDDTIEHTGKAFMGLTLNCAKCHDHKYDPLSQIDYYNMRAIFEPHQVRLDPLPGSADLEFDGLPRVFDDDLAAVTQLHRRGDPAQPDPDSIITAGIPALFASAQPAIEPIDLPVEAYAPATREYARQAQRRAVQSRLDQAQAQLATARQQLRHSQGELTGELVLSEDFERADPTRWQVLGEGWEYRDGSLHQTQATRQPDRIILQSEVPDDFELICRYTTTGGTVYKSVTWRLDESPDGENANLVYTSAHEPDPKVQAAFVRGGQALYPGEGRAARSIEVGRAYQVRLAIRGTLVNVWLDDQFALAFRFPERLPGGRLSLSAFDATAAFHQLTIRSLPDDYPLTEPGAAGSSASALEPAAAMELAEARWEAAEAAQRSLTATLAADDVRFGLVPGDLPPLARQARRAQLELQLAEARVQRLEAGDKEQPRQAAAQRIEQLEQQLAALAEDDQDYVSLNVSRKALETPEHQFEDYPAVYSPVSSGRRLALARWIASTDNPLTARVAVNHIWLRHFGQPLVEDVFDFGLRTPPPAQHELLDYLAARFMHSGWSMKQLHRLLVTSELYALGDVHYGDDRNADERDPANGYWWRGNVRRMESQVVRDCLLELAGQLDHSLGGPSQDVGPTSRRRSLYFKHSPDHQDQFLAMFDDADLLQCYRRSESIVPQQSLALSNSRLALEMADAIAQRISAALPADADSIAFIQRAFATILARAARADELEACRQFCEQLTGELAGDWEADTLQLRVHSRLVHSLLNHNDFVSIR